MKRLWKIVAAVIAASVAPAAAQAWHPGDEPHPPITWAEKPDVDELQSVTPNQAILNGLKKGSAVIDCEVNRNGWLKRCEVVEESPEGNDFGKAALALAPFFRFNVPEVLKDMPTEVRVPIVWELGSTESRTVVTKSIWMKAPTSGQVAAAYPAGMSGDARVMFQCILQKDGSVSVCKRLNGHPSDSKFTNAARALIPTFRMRAELDGKSLAGARILLPIQLLDPKLTEQRDSPVPTRPTWSGVPGPDLMTYPAAARAKGVTRGRGDVNCAIGKDGVMTDCRVTKETPEGLGFGEAALKAAGGFVLNPWSYDGRPVEGARITLPVGFVDDQAPAQAAAPAK